MANYQDIKALVLDFYEELETASANSVCNTMSVPTDTSTEKLE